MKTNCTCRHLVAITLAIVLAPITLFATPPASDKASDPAYSGGWTNGLNGGVGWPTNGWTLFVAGSPSNATAVTHFISSSLTNNSSGDTNGDGDIDTAGVAWGMLGNGQEVDAARLLNGALVDGQKLIIEMDNGPIVSGGQQVGLIVQSSLGETRLSFLLQTNSATYEMQGLSTIDTGITNTDQGLQFAFEQVSSDTGHVFVTKLVDGSSIVFSNVPLKVAAVTAHDVGAFSLINKSAGGAATNRLFFNSISILPNPADPTLFADLSVTKSASLSPAIVSSNLTYTITITNNGPAQATAVIVTDVPPSGVTFVSAAASQGVCTTNGSGLVICDLGLLASNATASITAVVTPLATSVLTNIASASSLNVDPVAANNLATNIVNVVPLVQLSVSPTNLAFNTIAVSATQALSFVVTNLGGTALNGTATVTSAAFSIASGSPFSVAGLGSTNVSVNFTPPSAGGFTNNVTFASNGGVSTNVVTGTGAIAASASFTGAPLSGLAPLSVTFTDASTGTIANRFWSFGDGGTTNTTSTNVVYQYVTAGTFTVNLTASGPLGTNTFQRSNYITVTNLGPVTAFTGTPTNGVVPLSVTFTDASTGSITNRFWNFGDSVSTNTTSTNVVHQYSNAGTFSVSLTTFGSGGTNTLLRSNYIIVTNVAALASFTGSPTTGAAPVLVTFTNTSTGTITNQLWSFGDSGTSTLANPTHSYTNGGAFSVNLTVFGPLGSNSLTRSNYIIVTNLAPVAGFTASPTNGSASLAVTFTDASSGSITGRLWNFGDSGTSTATSPSHTYTNAGTFSVSLTVLGPGGTNTLAQPNLITVTNLSAVAGFTGTPTNGSAPLIVSFTDASSGTITGRVWSFGDGATSASTSPSHTYTNAGTFSVNLTVFGPLGSNSLTRSNYITTTNLPPVAGFTGTPTNGPMPLLVSFTDASSGTITGRVWSFGDSGTSTATSPSHTYTNVGTFSVSLTVRGPLGSNTLTRSSYITVTTNHPPLITAGLSVTNAVLLVGSNAVVVAGETNTYAVTATDPENDTLTYQWVFGDGASTNTTAVETVDHVSTNECGPYDASVTVSDGQNSTNSHLTVVVACEMQITKMKAKLDFKKSDADTCSLTATNLALPDAFTLAGKSVTLSIGGAQVSFTFDSKGHQVKNTQGTCKLSFEKKTSTWTMKANLKKTDFQSEWIDEGLVNDDVPKPGTAVTLAVIVLVDDEAFMADKSLLYTAKADKSGSAK